MDSATASITLGKMATASASIPAYPPALAVDGNCTDLKSSWQTDPYPASLMIDLEKKCEVNKIHVWPYWGLKRYYRYTVEVSPDGHQWKRIGDKSENTAASTPRGDRFEFPATEIRYIRINMLYHNLNKGVHIVEVKAFAPEEKP
jgi:hypothetical protein